MSGVTITLVNPDPGLLARSTDDWRPSPDGGGHFVLAVPKDADLVRADWSDGQSVWVSSPDREVS
jgi:hypothetical protein